MTEPTSINENPEGQVVSKTTDLSETLGCVFPTSYGAKHKMSDRNQEIIDLYRQGSTATALARTFGLSEPRIRQIVSGVKKEKLLELQPISRAHKRLGVIICDHRFDQKVERKNMAQKLGWSIAKLRHIEQGLRDPTLMDLQDLASYMKKDLGALVNNVFTRH